MVGRHHLASRVLPSTVAVNRAPLSNHLHVGGPRRGPGHREGTVVLAVTECVQRDCWHENPPRWPAPVPRSAFAGFRFPPDVIVLAVRWYLRFGLSYRDVENCSPSAVSRSTTSPSTGGCSGSRRCSPRLPAPAATPWVIVGSWTRPTSRWPATGATSTVRSTSSARSSTCSSRHSATPRPPAASSSGPSPRTKITPVEVVTDKAATSPTALGELLPAAWHRTDRYANNHLEADHGRLKSRLGPMRGLKQDGSARVVIAGHAFVQNLRRGHYELAVEEPVDPARGGRVRRARFGDLTPAGCRRFSVPRTHQTQQCPQGHLPPMGRQAAARRSWTASVCCKPQGTPRSRSAYVADLVCAATVRRVGLRVVLDLGRCRPGGSRRPPGARERHQPVWDHPRHRRGAGSGWEQARGWRSRVILQDQPSTPLDTSSTLPRLSCWPLTAAVRC